MPFIGILSSFSRKGENVRNFAFLRGIFGFCALFRFFGPKWKKSQKCVLSEKYLSVPLTKRIYIYVFFPGSKENQLFRTFPTFSFLGRLEWKKCSGAQKSAKIRFFAPKSGKMRFWRFGPENTSQNLMFIKLFTLWRKQCFFAFSGFFTFCWKYFSLLPRRFYE